LNIKHLEYLYTLAKTRHFAKAADLCCVTQPTLSAGIAKLEQALGADLVIRDRRFVALTEQGKLVVEHAQSILFEQQSIKHKISEMQSGLSGTLKLGIVPQSNVDIMPLLKAFNQHYPDIMISLSVMTNQQMIVGLTEHQIDLGLGFEDAAVHQLSNQFEIYRQGSNPLAVLLTEQQAICYQKAEHLTPQQVAHLPLCLLNKNMQFRQTIDNTFLSLSLKPNLVFETDSLFHLLNAVKQGLGCALVTLETAKTASDMFTIDYKPVERTQTPETLFISRRAHVSVIAKAFIEQLK